MVIMVVAGSLVTMAVAAPREVTTAVGMAADTVAITATDGTEGPPSEPARLRALGRPAP